MKTIWKFPVEIDRTVHIAMPKGAEILSVQCQYDSPQLWAICDTDADVETRHFEIYETGHVLSDTNKRYIATFQMRDGQLVFHIFETIG